MYCAGSVIDNLGNFAVVLPRGPRVRSPAVEGPVNSAKLTALVEHKGWADVAHPKIVKRSFNNVNTAIEASCCLTASGRVDHHRHRLELDNRVCDCRPTCPALFS